MEPGVSLTESKNFSPDRYAVPIGNTSGSDYAVGTGFLGRSHGRVAFYTAAHNLAADPVMGRLLPINEWAWLAANIYIHPDFDGEPQPLQTFTSASPKGAFPGSEGGESFNFSWTEQEAGFIKDAVKFDVSRMPALFEACKGRFEIIDLDTAVHQLTTEDHLTSVGFPTPDGFPVAAAWPYFPPARCGGYFVKVDNGHIQAGFRAPKGFSGGPVFLDDGRFAGMLVGCDAGIAMGSRYMFSRIVAPQDVINL